MTINNIVSLNIANPIYLAPSSSIAFVPIPSDTCGSSVMLKSSAAILFLKLFEKQLFFSDIVLKLKLDATTNDNNSPTE